MFFFHALKVAGPEKAVFEHEAVRLGIHTSPKGSGKC